MTNTHFVYLPTKRKRNLLLFSTTHPTNIDQQLCAFDGLLETVITLTISIRTNYEVHYFNDFKLRMYLLTKAVRSNASRLVPLAQYISDERILTHKPARYIGV